MKYLVANWKMKLTIAESVDLARHAREWYEASAHPPFALIICPSPCAIPAVADALKGSTIGLGAQDVGETEAERAAGEAEEVVRRQVRLALSQISSLPRTSALRHEDDNTPHAL